MSLHHQFINGKTADRRHRNLLASEGKQAGGFFARSTVGSLEAGDAVANIISETQVTEWSIVSDVFDYAVCIHSLELIAQCSNHGAFRALCGDDRANEQAGINNRVVGSLFKAPDLDRHPCPHRTLADTGRSYESKLTKNYGH
jgi:hypothetical protein